MNDERPIIKVVKKGGHGHHGGAWKVAYADFVTAMMAFFLVMWILGLNQDTRKAIAAYFQDPSGFLKSHAGGISPITTNREITSGKPSILPSATSAIKARERESQRFKEAKKALERKIARAPELKRLKQHVRIEIAENGLRIELVEASESLFFRTGVARLTPEAARLLRLVGQELAKLPNSIEIEGHTDRRPYVGGDSGYSNWELSADRANSARQALVPVLRSGQVTQVSGYADQRLRSPEDPYHYTNRRVSILVRYSDAATPSPTAIAHLNGRIQPIAPPPVDLLRD